MTDHTKARAPFAPWDRRELPGLFTVEETARRVGNYKWAEMRLFEVLGGWVATVPELDVKMVLGRHTYHHAWHSELWHKRLPELREMNPDRLTLDALLVGGAMACTFYKAMDSGRPTAIASLMYGPFPRMLAIMSVCSCTYGSTAVCPPRSVLESIAPFEHTIRSLTFAIQDEFEDWRDGEMLIQSLLDTPEKVRRAARRQEELEQLVLASGGIAGPGSLGEPAQEESVA